MGTANKSAENTNGKSDVVKETCGACLATLDPNGEYATAEVNNGVVSKLCHECENTVGKGASGTPWFVEQQVDSTLNMLRSKSNSRERLSSVAKLIRKRRDEGTATKHETYALEKIEEKEGGAASRFLHRVGKLADYGVRITVAFISLDYLATTQQALSHLLADITAFVPLQPLLAFECLVAGIMAFKADRPSKESIKKALDAINQRTR